MLNYILKKIVGTQNDREIKRLTVIMNEVSKQEPLIESLTDSELRAKTPYSRINLLEEPLLMIFSWRHLPLSGKHL